jgi:hypothetical protein
MKLIGWAVFFKNSAFPFMVSAHEPDLTKVDGGHNMYVVPVEIIKR